jgi:hypothetical protein
MKHKTLTMLLISLFSANTFASQIKITSKEFGHSSGVKDAGFIMKKDEVRTLSDDEIKKTNQTR